MTTHPTAIKIFKVASKMFLEKGVDKISIRDIAQEAQVNISMVNYHFKSKDHLIIEIINQKTERLHNQLNEVLISPISLDKKINLYVSTFLDLLIEEPGILLFLFSILHSRPDLIQQSLISDKFYDIAPFCLQLEKEANKGSITKCNPEQLYIAMLSLIVFPVAISSFIATNKNISKIGVKNYIRNQKEMITSMLISYLNCNQSMPKN